MKKKIMLLLYGVIFLHYSCCLQAMMPTLRSRIKQIAPRYPKGVQQGRLVQTKTMITDKNNWKTTLQPTQQSLWGSLSSAFSSFVRQYYDKDYKVRYTALNQLDDLIDELENILFQQDDKKSLVSTDVSMFEDSKDPLLGVASNQSDKVQQLRQKILLVNLASYPYKKEFIARIAALIESYMHTAKTQGRFDCDSKNDPALGLLVDTIEYLFLIDGDKIGSSAWNTVFQQYSSLESMLSRLGLLKKFELYDNEYSNDSVARLLGVYWETNEYKVEYARIKQGYDEFLESYNSRQIIDDVQSGRMIFEWANIKLKLINKVEKAWDRYLGTVSKEEQSNLQYKEQQVAARQKKLIEGPAMQESERTINDLLGLPEGVSKDQIDKKRKEFLMQYHPDKVRQLAAQEQIELIKKAKEINVAWGAYNEKYNKKENRE